MTSLIRVAAFAALTAGLLPLTAAPAQANSVGCSLYQSEVASVQTKHKAASICRSSDGSLEYRGIDLRKSTRTNIPVVRVERAGGATVYATRPDEWELTYRVIDQTSLVITGKHNHVWFDEKQQ